MCLFIFYFSYALPSAYSLPLVDLSYSSTLLFFFLLSRHFLFCFISLRAHRLLFYSSPTLSLVLFSHSPHSHASPSAVFTLPHSSSFPFSRFSLSISFTIFLPLYSHSLPSRTLPEAILSSFSSVSRQSVSPSHYPLLVSLQSTGIAE